MYYKKKQDRIINSHSAISINLNIEIMSGWLVVSDISPTLKYIRGLETPHKALTSLPKLVIHVTTHDKKDLKTFKPQETNQVTATRNMPYF